MTKETSHHGPNPPRRRSRSRLAFVLALTLLAVALLIVGLVELSCRRSDRRAFLDLKGTLTSTQETPLASTPGHRTIEIDLEDDRGLAVVGHLRTPIESERPMPAFLILGGVRTGRRSLDYIPEFRHAVLLALDYPYEGKKSGLGVVEFATALPAMRRAVMRTVPAAMLAVDYLLTRSDVDPDRIVVVSGSVGTLFAPAVVASDPRVAGLVMLFGGGDIQSLLEHIAAEDLGWFTKPGAWLGKALTCPVEPLQHIADVSPRPVFMLNGTDDLGIPEHNTRLLFESASEPKTLRWIEAGHVLLKDPAFHQQVTAELVDWLIEEGFLDPAEISHSTANSD